MQKLQETYAVNDVVRLSICSSANGKQGNFSPDEWKDIIKERGIKATAVLLDGDGEVGKMYGAKNTPEMVVINPEGNMIYHGAIDDRPSPRPADIKGATNYVAAVLDAAMAGKEIPHAKTQALCWLVKY